ncbi:hypothetical protein CHU00_12355 [Sphingobacterium cellulitidis]|uniref:helix-turn-helix transcriptional regulator n=1 Tax=Sphingobacterium cellulitidis TaxID=1768011 RepID=UPI000B941905|nr:WYL domain-containing protein [Sphingobacterium cellulitidis]OYD45430.1 hypothetical protein CHU00_12355 [Sphingobacterium cellulitidis]
MSVRETIIRHKLIINYLRNKPRTWVEIDQYLKRESELQDYKLSISQRQFQRDIEDILPLYGVIIQNNRSKKCYYIENLDNEADRSLEILDVLNILRIGNNGSNNIVFENRRPSGSENLWPMVQAMRGERAITFSYHKFYENYAEDRKLFPMVLKEVKNRWYILGHDLEKMSLRVFGLDRITDLEIGGKLSLPKQSLDTDFLFKHCFGIILPNKDQKVEEVILSYSPFQARYVKSLPLHNTQEVILENENEVRIKLNIYVTHDFIMELLSVAGEVKVIAPTSLKEEVAREHQRALIP